jgi:hypothetical protein
MGDCPCQKNSQNMLLLGLCYYLGQLWVVILDEKDGYHAGYGPCNLRDFFFPGKY